MLAAGSTTVAIVIAIIALAATGVVAGTEVVDVADVNPWVWASRLVIALDVAAAAAVTSISKGRYGTDEGPTACRGAASPFDRLRVESPPVLTYVWGAACGNTITGIAQSSQRLIRDSF